MANPIYINWRLKLLSAIRVPAEMPNPSMH